MQTIFFPSKKTAGDNFCTVRCKINFTKYLREIKASLCCHVKWDFIIKKRTRNACECVSMINEIKTSPAENTSINVKNNFSIQLAVVLLRSAPSTKLLKKFLFPLPSNTHRSRVFIISFYFNRIAVCFLAISSRL